MGIHTVWSVLLLSAYFLSVYEIRMGARHHVRWQDVAASGHWAGLTFLEADGHRGHDAMGVVVHLEDLLLLSSQVLGLVLSIHYCETHWTWHKDVVVLAIGCSSVWRFYEVILVWCALIDWLNLLIILILRVFATVVCNVSSILSRDRSLLVVAVQVLDIQWVPSLVVAQLSSGSWLKSLILGTSSALGVQVLSEIIIGWL